MSVMSGKGFIMAFRLIWSMIKQGVLGFFRNLSTSFAAVLSNSCVFVLLGVIIILILSANNLTLDLEMRANQVVVFLERDLTDFQIGNLEQRLKSMPEILSIRFVSREEAFKSLKDEMGGDAYLLDNLGSNPLQDFYEIELKDLSMADSLTKKISELPEIESANYHKELMDNLMKVTKYIHLLGMALITVLLVISMVIISNTTKISIAARRKEINIMKYVGASNEFIKGPFVIEAMITGLLSAGLAVLVIEFFYTLFYRNADLDLYELLTRYLVTPEYLLGDALVIFITIGLGVGAIGSIWSLRKHMDV